MTPEQQARVEIDRLLTAANWTLQSRDQVDLTASQGIAIREFPLKKGHGFADYLLYVDGAAVGVIEAKRAGTPLVGVETQTARYSVGLPDDLPAPRRPLPFCYESTGVETRFTNLLEPDARSRPVFAFHKPETLAQWIHAESRHPGSIYKINQKDLESIRVPAPPVDQQKDRFANWSATESILMNLTRAATISVSRAARLRPSHPRQSLLRPTRPSGPN